MHVVTAPPSKPSSTEQWHHAGKIHILLIPPCGRQSCGPSTQHALHHPGHHFALLSSKRFAEQVLAIALLSAELEEGSATSREAAAASALRLDQQCSERWDHEGITVVN